MTKRINTTRENIYFEISEWTLPGWEGWHTVYEINHRGTREMGRFESEKDAVEAVAFFAERARLTLAR